MYTTDYNRKQKYNSALVNNILVNNVLFITFCCYLYVWFFERWEI